MEQWQRDCFEVIPKFPDRWKHESFSRILVFIDKYHCFAWKSTGQRCLAAAMSQSVEEIQNIWDEGNRRKLPVDSWAHLGGIWWETILPSLAFGQSALKWRDPPQSLDAQQWELNGGGRTCEVSIVIFSQRALSHLWSPFTQTLVGSPARNDAGSSPARPFFFLFHRTRLAQILSQTYARMI